MTNKHVNKNLVKTVSIITKFAKSKQLSEFIDELYTSVSYEDLKDFDPKYLFHCANSTYNVLKSKVDNEPRIEHFVDPSNDEYAIIQVVNADVPFLIDSIGNELKLRQIDINLITHSMFNVKRDKNGKFIDFASNGSKEYVIQIHIPNRFHGEYLDNITLKIKEILECVNYCVEDWPGMRTGMQKASQALPKDFDKITDIIKAESIDFLEWLTANNFVFLGAISCSFNGSKITVNTLSKLGLLRSHLYDIKTLPYEAELKSDDYVVIRKWDARSIVHRTANIDIIIVKKFDSKKKCIGADLYFGLFTSTVYYQSVRNIPLIRQKINYVIEKYGFPEASHNCKELVTTLESFPRGEILQMNVDELFDTAINIVSLMLIPRVKLLLRKYPAGNFVSCIIFIPEKKFSSEVRVMIESIICQKLKAVITKRYVQVNEGSLSRLQLVVKFLEEIKIDKKLTDEIEKEIIKEISNWSDELYDALIKRYAKKPASFYHNKYADAFDVKYKSVFSGAKAVHDIKFIEKAIAKDEVGFDLYVRSFEDKSHSVHLKIYSPGKEQTLSSTLPLIEHLGLEALDVEIYKISVNGEGKNHIVYLSHFRLASKNKDIFISDEVCSKAQEALYKVWAKSIDDDGFNALIITAGLDYRQANLIRSYVRYLRQTKYPLSMDYTLQVLLDHPDITKKMIELFEVKFNPNLSDKERKRAIALELNLRDDLGDIKGINEDRVIRSILGVISATLRTNYYKVDEVGHPKEYISLKMKSSEIIDLPFPRPFAEIFVYSPRVEGIHLRGGKIARGGLRWSDRPEDFRTEVLGLMKAQMTKNSVIVPVGSKGGFVVKRVQSSDGRDEYLAEGIACYKTFLSGLLDITDNIVAGNVVAPVNVVRLDGDDPYLVVAADKGTATFSDYANEVSRNYKFWLDDAFASGGSVGYDHKKMGITAKGAWISVVRHFEDMGIDIGKTEFTTVGIGDMSGDVFGNGMLLSGKIKLVAAFNHIHIFLDPNPVAEASFAERKRLFNMPRSGWADYNPKLISKGGGVYDRKQKSIPISGEVKAILGIQNDNLGPDDLIRAILMAPVDLLWNGGIGTYVKAKTEANERIGDKTNDALRIDGAQLKAKVVGEGGNLGFTQLGRIEYARKGGRLNTDFIDNSAGVDCSDHEVNIKIAFADPIITGKIKIAERNKCLESMTNEVAGLVLTDNYKQTQILTLEQQSNFKKLNSHAWLIHYLEHEGSLDRDIEFLPQEDELQKLLKDNSNLTRPEISVLLAYAKNSALRLLTNVELSSDKYLNKYLFKYFPDKLVIKYKKYLEKHILNDEIIGTVLINDFINMLGCTFFHQILDETGARVEDIVKAFVVVLDVFDIDTLWSKVEQLDPSVPVDLKIILFNRIQSILGRNITWLLNIHVNIKDVSSTVDFYKSGLTLLRKSLNKLSTNLMKKELVRDLEEFENYKKAYDVAGMISILGELNTAFDIIYVANEAKSKIEKTAKIYYAYSDSFHIRWLVLQARSFVPKQHLQIVALRTLVSEINLLHMRIVDQELKDPGLLERCSILTDRHHSKFMRFNDYIKDFMSSDTSEVLVSKLTIATKYLKELVACGEDKII